MTDQGARASGTCPRRDSCPWGRLPTSRGVRPGGLRSRDAVQPESVLVAASHGTSCCAGDGAVRALVAALIERSEASGGPPVVQAFVDVQQPDVPAALGSLGSGQPAIIVPLLLSAGYHVRVDLTDAAGADERSVAIAGALGPDDALIEVLVQRLDQAGLTPSDAIVLVAAGSSDPLAVDDCRDTAARLGIALGRDVTIGFLSAASPALPEAISRTRQSHPGSRVVASTYLLAPGYFAELVQRAGADVVTEPLLPPDGSPPRELVDIILSRYAAAAASAEAARAATAHPVPAHPVATHPVTSH